MPRFENAERIKLSVFARTQMALRKILLKAEGRRLLPTRVLGLIFYNFEHVYSKTAGVVIQKKRTDQTDNIYLIVTNQLTESFN
jgi:hypothetical protein